MKKYVCEKCRMPVALSDKFCGYCGAEFSKGGSFVLDDEEQLSGTSDLLELTSSLRPRQILYWMFHNPIVEKEGLSIGFSIDNALFAHSFGKITRSFGKRPFMDVKGRLFIEGKSGLQEVATVKGLYSGPDLATGEVDEKEYEAMAVAFKEEGWWLTPELEEFIAERGYVEPNYDE